MKAESLTARQLLVLLGVEATEHIESYAARLLGTDIVGLRALRNVAMAEFVRLTVPPIKPDPFCCECGDEYPLTDIEAYGHIFCAACRERGMK